MILNASQSRGGLFPPSITKIKLSYKLQVYNNQYLKNNYTHFIIFHINDKNEINIMYNTILFLLIYFDFTSKNDEGCQ